MHMSQNYSMISRGRGDRFRIGLVCCLVIIIGSQVLRAGTEYTTIKDITIDVSGQKVELKEGQKVMVMGVHNGMAVIQVVLPDGSKSIVQSPEASFQAPAAPPVVAAPPAPPPPVVVSQPAPAPPPVPPPAAAVPPAAPPTPAVSTSTDKPSLTKEQVDALIEQAGNTKPDWWDSTPLNIPPTLDLTWKTQGGSRNDIGAYLWNVVHPNPSKWKEAIKLLQESLRVCKGDPVAQEKAATSLSGIYTEMLGDYPRGAFWAKKSSRREIGLAECYMKLGCPSAAIDILRGIGSDQTRNGQAIKLWAELGDLKTALDWADKLAPSDPTVANLAAGDACRRFGKIPEALAYYQKVLDVSQQVQRDDPVNKKRAAASIAAIKLFDGLDLQKIPDGSYKADSIGYVGPVEVTVTVQDHKIADVKVTNHHEKQFYSSLVDVPPQIVAKQSVKGIDTTTGATVTSEAIIYATAKALSGAQK